ncbi:hypothetical protein [Paraburkholderia caffeinilytica]
MDLVDGLYVARVFVCVTRYWDQARLSGLTGYANALRIGKE